MRCGLKDSRPAVRPSGRQLYNSVRICSRELRVVRRDEQPTPLFTQLPQRRPQRTAARRVERRCRFVHEQQRGIWRERARDRDPLRLAPGQLTRPRPSPRADVQRSEQVRRDRLGCAAALTQDVPQRQGHIVECGEVGKQRVRLEDEPDPPPQRDEPRLGRYATGCERESIDDDPSFIERLQRDNRPQCRRLPHTRRTHQRHEFPACDLERQRTQHASRVIPNREPVDHKERAHAAGLQRRSSRRAKRASGSDIARYTAAHSAPGTTQLPTLVA